MSAARDILNEANAQGVNVYLSGDAVRISFKDRPSEEFMARLRAAKQDIRDELASAPRCPPIGFVQRICSTCGTYPAPFGVGVFPHVGLEGQWFCGKCRPNEDR